MARQYKYLLAEKIVGVAYYTVVAHSREEAESIASSGEVDMDDYRIEHTARFRALARHAYPSEGDEQ